MRGVTHNRVIIASQAMEKLMTDEIEQGVTEHVAEAQETQQNSKEYNFEALRQKAEQLEQHNRAMQLRLMEMEKQKPQQQQVNFSDDDVPTWGELKRVREGELSEIKALKDELNEIRTRSRYTDYDQTIREYLPDVLQEDPDLAMAIQNNPMMHRLAYKLAQASPRYHQERMSKNNQATVNKIVENSTRPQPATSRKNVSVQDEDARMTSMSDDQIMAMFNMAKARS